ncbi:X-ray repair cross-complementing protein 6 [Cichlidogyrus casuarinus]|uniref:X-ray repair cross-complementing protein 6 n=1 Tax=Cichlidogyrus casuarinus TaxID=1844966 RepID=A0ABD2Q6R0_9PLAT
MGSKLICFDSQEIKNDMKKFDKPGLYLLGFKKTDSIKPHYHIKSSHFIFIDMETARAGAPWFLAMIDRCLDRELLPICLYTQRENATPRLVALYPQKPVPEEQIPAGFNAVFLPYAEDFQRPQNLITPVELEPESMEVQLARKIVQKLKRSYSPEMITNPALRRFYAHLENSTYDNADCTLPKDLTLPAVKRIQAKVGDALEEFRRVCGLKLVSEEDNKPKSRKRKADVDEEAKPAATKARAKKVK